MLMGFAEPSEFKLDPLGSGARSFEAQFRGRLVWFPIQSAGHFVYVHFV